MAEILDNTLNKIKKLADLISKNKFQSFKSYRLPFIKTPNSSCVIYNMKEYKQLILIDTDKK